MCKLEERHGSSRRAVANAPPGSRGTTLAVHSTLGFGAAFLGPLAVGMVLDLLQGKSDLAWGMAFVCMGAGCALGPLALRLQKTQAHSRNNEK